MVRSARLPRRSDGAIAFDVVMDSNVLYDRRDRNAKKYGTGDAIMAALEAGATTNVASEVQEGTLLHFHQRFGHLAFDTIERMARDPASGIFTDEQQAHGVRLVHGG